jgi:hypothetical protein
MKAENNMFSAFFFLFVKIATEYIIRIILFYTFTQTKHISTK